MTAGLPRRSVVAGEELIPMIRGLLHGLATLALTYDNSPLTGVAKNTIVKLLVELGAACTRYQDETLRNLPCKRLQCDEIWSFVGGKDKNLSEEKKADGLGSVWTWTCIDADTKLVPSWLVGGRDAGTAYEFMSDVAGRLHGRVQLTTDGHKPYLAAVEDAFGSDIDYATLTKLYGNDPESEKRYSPPKCIGQDRYGRS